MYKNSGIVIAALIVILAANSCKKDGVDNTEVTFMNNLDSQVILDIYSNISDYQNNTNLTVRKVINAHERVTVPASTLKEGQSYFMDWYSKDYYYNNWFNDEFSVGSQVAFKPSVSANTFYIKPDYKSLSRTVYLNGGGSQSKWVAVDAYLFNDTKYKSYWSQLTVAEKYRELTVNKNFTAMYTYKDATGTTHTDELKFMVHNTPNAYLEFMDKGATTGEIVSGILPTAMPPDYKSNSTDTVKALLPNSDYYFLMVKE